MVKRLTYSCVVDFNILYFFRVQRLKESSIERYKNGSDSRRKASSVSSSSSIKSERKYEFEPLPKSKLIEEMMLEEATEENEDEGKETWVRSAPADLYYERDKA